MGYVGFKPLRRGRIHLFCPECKRKLSNMPRQPEDPTRAVLAKVLCPGCADRIGAKDSSVDYLDANGRFIDWQPDAEPKPPRRDGR